MAFQFNHDLLLSDADRDAARGLFPGIYFALDNPELRARFIEFNTMATRAKSRSRRWGLTAVALATIALLVVSADQLYEWLHLGEEAKRWLLIVAATCGLFGVLIGMFGTLFSTRARRWLEHRMAAERLRQFHFQWLVAKAPEIAEAAEKPELREALVARRKAEFAGFSRDVLDHLDAEFVAVLGEEDAPGGWLIRPSERAVSSESPGLREIFSAYERLRLKPQLQYATYRLHAEGAGHVTPVRQAALFSAIALSCVLIVFILHGLALAGALHSPPWSWEPVIHTAAIWSAIIALAIRTLEEGLQPHKQIERLREYRSAVRLINERMSIADTPQAKLAAMHEMEEVAYEEMINFLKSNAEARFLM